jgi:hypothetical protein
MQAVSRMGNDGGIKLAMTKRRILVLIMVIFAVLALGVVLTQPLFLHRLTTKAFTGYEIYLLKYPNSQLVETEIRATSKVTMATDYTFYSSDDLDTILEYMEQQRPGFVHVSGSRVINEPTFRNNTCADETAFRSIFQVLERGTPCIEVYIYPSSTSGTTVKISEIWSSMGFPAWLRK